MLSPSFCFVLHINCFFGEFQICQAAGGGGGECVWWEWRHDFAWIVDGIGKSHRSSQWKGIFSTQTHIGRLANYRNQHWHFCWKPASIDHRPGKGTTIHRHIMYKIHTRITPIFLAEKSMFKKVGDHSLFLTKNLLFNF